MHAKTILLATDLSCRCDRALDRAAMLARERQSRLVVLHVVPDMGSMDRDEVTRTARERVLRDLQKNEGLDVEVIVESGDPAGSILAVCERLDCGLIVTGVARDETLGRMLLGSTVTHLTGRAGVPVLVVKSRPWEPYRHAVVATDFSENSRHALLAALALLPSASLSLFHAPGSQFGSMADSKEAVIETALHHARREFREFLEATPEAGASNRDIQTHCEYGEIGGLLESFIARRGVDLVVMGTQGRSRLAGLLLGSTSRHLLASLSTDMLVVKGP